MADDRAQRLAMLLQAIEDCDREFKDEKREYLERRNRLVSDAYRLRREIIDGQMTLLEEKPA